jgi:hypothetical protein
MSGLISSRYAPASARAENTRPVRVGHPGQGRFTSARAESAKSHQFRAYRATVHLRLSGGEPAPFSSGAGSVLTFRPPMRKNRRS